MKKLLVVTTLVLMMFNAFATLGGGNWSFEPINAQDLYKESAYDPYAFKTQLGVVYFPNKEDATLKVRIAVAETGETDLSKVQYIDVKSEDIDSPIYFKGKFATDIGLAHTTFDNGKFPKIEAQFSVKGYFNLFIYGSSSNAVQGFDGSFFLGPEFKVADKLALRVGLHHLSGHYGDEVLERMLDKVDEATTELAQKTITVDGKTYTYYGTTQYVRDNELLLSASYDLPLGFRPYFQFAIPTHNAWVRPFIHNPEGMEQTIAHIARGEGMIPENTIGTAVAEREIALRNGAFYKAIRINAGFEWKMQFKYFGVAAGADFQFNQDGMTKHMPNSFSKDNPWEFEYTLGTSFELYNALLSKNLSIDFIYHDGRVPMLNYYYIHTKMLYVGFGIH